jgi:hypothetical protein
VREEKGAFDYSIFAATNSQLRVCAASAEKFVIPGKYHDQVTLAQCQAKYLLYTDAVESLMCDLNPQTLANGKP